ncbi:MAG TPA: hypothetical protein VND96_09465 [Candidatus Micrarchaeaceae archaeon]|nr:hypothetical protein [Candidatus Micrarchaeaceae archaeon]
MGFMDGELSSSEVVLMALKGAVRPKAAGVKRTLNVVRCDPSVLDPVPGRLVFGVAGDNVTRALAKLTKDVERFDSMIRNQRHLLQEHGAEPGPLDRKLIRRQSRRISVCGIQIMTQARGALRELGSIIDVDEVGS